MPPPAPLTRGLELLESAVAYALAGAAMATTQRLSSPTPCRDWQLGTLLEHVTDSADALHEAISGAPTRPAGADPATRLRGQLLALLNATAKPTARRVRIWDHELPAHVVAVTGALEIAVHGWDITVACGGSRPIPPGLATVLLAAAPALVPAGVRGELFADPVRLPGRACPSDELVGFLGRQPFRGESARCTWSV
jgi:uncharacterized protein (TIGR03086 family)